MILRIYPENPSEKTVRQVADLLRAGGIIIYPTDGVYAYGCALSNPKGIDKLRAVSGKGSSDFSIVCADLSTVATYAKVSTPLFKLLKKNLPGPFTFILEASSKTPNKCLERRKNVGIRIPDNPIALAIIEELGCPLLSASVKNDDLETEYTTDPSLIHEYFGHKVDLVVDGGYGEFIPSTVVDCTGDEPIILREGKGELRS